MTEYHKSKIGKQSTLEVTEAHFAPIPGDISMMIAALRSLFGKYGKENDGIRFIISDFLPW